MAADNIETPAQKLLKVIETPSEEKVSSAKLKRERSASGGSVGFLKSLNLLLFLGIIAAGVFLFQEFKNGNDLMAQEIAMPPVGSSARFRNREALMPTIQRLSFYTAPLNRRNLFEPYVQKVQQVVEVTDMNKTIANKTSHLKLVGVSWMNTIDSASVMLEDTSKETTHFLQKDEALGDINIKTIYADSVELGFQDEEIMIYYDIPQP